jgi:hypothetical protein
MDSPRCIAVQNVCTLSATNRSENLIINIPQIIRRCDHRENPRTVIGTHTRLAAPADPRGIGAMA